MNISVVQKILAASPIGMACLLLLVGFLGCSQDLTPWPNRTGDFAQVAAGRGMAMSWGVVFEIENVVGDESQQTNEGTFGDETETSDARHKLVLGDFNIELSPAADKKFNLSVNGRKYGQVSRGDQIRIDAEKTVFIFDKLRKPIE